MYVNKLREALESSSGYRRAVTVTDAKFVIAIVTMDPNEAELGSGAGNSTVAAVTLQLQQEGVKAFGDSFDSLIKRLEERRRALASV